MATSATHPHTPMTWLRRPRADATGCHCVDLSAAVAPASSSPLSPAPPAAPSEAVAAAPAISVPSSPLPLLSAGVGLGPCSLQIASRRYYARAATAKRTALSMNTDCCDSARTLDSTSTTVMLRPSRLRFDTEDLTSSGMYRLRRVPWPGK